MFYCRKPRFVAALAVVVGVGLASTGCRNNMGNCPPSASATYPTGQSPAQSAFNGNQGSNGTQAGNGAQTGNGTKGSNGGALASNGAQANNGTLPPNNTPKTGYVGDDAKGQAMIGAGPNQGLAGANGGPTDVAFGPIPRELGMVSLPPYTVAPPDILFIDTSRLVPKPPYRIDALEVLAIQVTDTLPNQPINGTFVVAPEGTVNLGYGYGIVRVQGLNTDQVQATIRQHLANVLRNPQVAVTLAQFRGQQQVRGEHLVRPDGTISLGTYGSVYVAGMTLGQVKTVVERHLKDYVINPQIAVDVYSYNSKCYYVVFDGGGYGQQIFRMPITGNETVLDAIANLQGMPPVASMWRVWIARPAPADHSCQQVLPVDWLAIVKGGATNTNYQIFPGDRVYVDADPLVRCDLWLAKILAPVERILGITLLGSSIYNDVTNNRNNNNN